MDINLENMSSASIDFLPAFRAIGHSLKNPSYKRFFRKPNVADAAQQYEALSAELAKEGQKEFSAVCAMEAAKCHETLQNPAQQATWLIKAARYYMDEHQDEVFFTADFEIRENPSKREHLEQAMDCLNKAVNIYISLQNFGLAYTHLLEMGELQTKAKFYGEALKHFKHAYAIAKENFNTEDQFSILQKVIMCKVKLTEYDNVLKTIDDFMNLANEKKNEISEELYDEIMEKFELMRVCLILILRTNPSTAYDILSTEINYLKMGKKKAKNLITIKSLIIAVNSTSVSDFHKVRNSLAPTMDEATFDLFDVLLEMIHG